MGVQLDFRVICRNMVDYTKFITSFSSKRKSGLIREMVKVLTSAPKEIIPLSAGQPNSKLFPFVKMTLDINDGTQITIQGPQLHKALQYQPTDGIPELISLVKNLQKEMHDPPNWENMDLLILPGSQDGLCKAMEMMLETDGKSTIITEEYLFTNALAIMEPYEPNMIKIKGDSDGMIPEELEKSLQNPNNSKDIKFIYINPTGCNPTGTVLTDKRKRQIYDLCSKHDIIILEDDPYYYLQYDPKRAKSFLSMDVDGRVLRFDSFSKMMSSGLRLGFMTGPKVLLERIALHMQVSVLHASSLSQVIVCELLKAWGTKGFHEHVRRVESFYEEQCKMMTSAATKYLNEVCEWTVPKSGMFLWISVPSVQDLNEDFFKEAFSRNVMLLPGRAFVNDPTLPCNSFRASFSIVSPEQVEEAFMILRQLVQEEIQAQSK
ncbi:kynurenine/alpha-aminoadipate aminotransferase, mitochondrial isoform X1 [Lepeophtheirus salmonis]|nr:kynurenine/alpha-aminoadipate aminotransferase, mitochondrial-like isoform X1 [Lepeophtheirus salmonis]